MKHLIALTVMLLSSVSFANSFPSNLETCNREAQVAGTVKNLTIHDGYFTFQIQPGGWYEPSMVCPLYAYEIDSAVIKREGYPHWIHNGKQISGILVFDQATQTYLLE